MLRVQNKIQFRTTKHGYAWILGFDSQAFRFGKGKPQAAEQEQEAKSLNHVLKTVLVLTILAGLTVIALLNFVR